MENKLKIPGIKKNPVTAGSICLCRKRPESFSFHFQGHLPYYRSRGLNQSINGVEVDPVDMNIVTFYIDMNQRRNSRYKERSVTESLFAVSYY